MSKTDDNMKRKKGKDGRNNRGKTKDKRVSIRLVFIEELKRERKHKKEMVKNV